MESIGYFLIGIAALCWMGLMFFGMLKAFPWGVIGLIGIIGVGILFMKVFVERVDNQEDDYYSHNVDK
ncbi:MAG: hypothetical protein JXR73_14520 [Candidatus Omnitrophica bacterium]|nr:hypothetical protein [Candidatus Omnitrophota bacterium]